MSDMTPAERRELVENFAAGHGLRAEWEGSIGFGRECVGLIDEERDAYVAYVDATGPPAEVAHAYHKAWYIAVLGRGDDVELELFEWVQRLALLNVRFERLPKVMTDLNAMVYGHRDEMVALPGDDEKRLAAIADRERLAALI